MDEGEKLELTGNLEQALGAYVRGKRWDQAARVAAAMGRNLDAGRYWLEGQRPYDAAICFRRVGALKECLAALLHVTHASPRYRDACVHAVSVAQITGTPLGNLISFLMPFFGSKPTSRAEAAAMNQIADEFGKSDKVRLAAGIFKSVLQTFPDDVDAREGLEALPPADRPSAPTAPTAPRTSAPGAGPAPQPSSPRPMPPGPGAAKTLRGARLGEVLVARGKLTQPQLEQVLQAQPALANLDLKLAEALVAAELVTELDVVQALAEQTGLPYISDEKLLAGASPVAAAVLSLEQAEKFHVAPVSLADRHLYVAMRDPRDVAVLDKVRFASSMSKVTGIFATDFGIRRTIAKLYHGEQASVTPDTWYGNLLDQMAGGEGPAPFSDRFTKTREHAFDTREFEQRLGAEPDAAPTLAQKSSATLPLSPATLPAVGTHFAGRYQLLELLGEGGSAAVFKAMDAELSEPVALKLFRNAAQTDGDDVIARFKLELSLSRLLTHPNIIRLFDLGLHAGWRYLTMELLEGTDVASLVGPEGKPLPLLDGLRHLEQVCVGLQFAHERGVVHRDIKPHNLFVTHEGLVKVMDFGIAKKVRTAGVTVSGMVLGTPEFISPEQINAFSNVTHLTDLYALGATAYMMFTGAPPFQHPEVMPLLMAQANDPPPPPSLRNPDLPDALEAVILKLLEKDPAKRFQSAKELGEALRLIREDLEAKAG